MKKFCVSLLLMLVSLSGLVTSASAAPLASTGSTYSVYIEGSDSGGATTMVGVFDGLPTPFIRSNLALTLSENEMDLGGGRSRITIDVSANGDLFPAIGETAIIGLGVDGNGLNFVVPVTLEQALIRLYAGAELLFESDNIVPNPPVEFWDGVFPGVGDALFIGEPGGPGPGGLGISRFELIFDVAGPMQQQVPEPGPLLLCAIALIALAGARRRRH